MIIFFIGSVDLDFVYYAKAAQKHCFQLPEFSSPTQQHSTSIITRSTSPSPSLDEFGSLDTILDEFETNITDSTTTGVEKSQNTSTTNPTIPINNNSENINDTNNTTYTSNETTEINLSSTPKMNTTEPTQAEYTMTEEANYAAERFFQYLDIHILFFIFNMYFYLC